MLRGADVVFLVALFSSHAQAEPNCPLNGNQSYATETGPPKGFVAIAEIGPPPRDVGDPLDDWDRIKRSNDVSELEAFVARYKDAFLADHRGAGSSSGAAKAVSGRVVPPPARLTPSN
jgi:hypothetical protein